MPIQSSQVNPGALRNDYSGFAEAGRIKGQMYANLGQNIKEGYKAHKEKIRSKAEEETAIKILTDMEKRMGGKRTPEEIKSIYKNGGMDAKTIIATGTKAQEMSQMQKQLQQQANQRKADAEQQRILNDREAAKLALEGAKTASTIAYQNGILGVQQSNADNPNPSAAKARFDAIAKAFPNKTYAELIAISENLTDNITDPQTGKTINYNRGTGVATPIEETLPPLDDPSESSSSDELEGKSLYELAPIVTGIIPSLQLYAQKWLGQPQFGGWDVAPAELIQARSTFNATNKGLIRAFRDGGKYIQGEADSIEKEIDIKPAWDKDPKTVQEQMKSLDRTLRRRVADYTDQANNQRLDTGHRKDAEYGAVQIATYLKILGVPQEGGAAPDISSVPPKMQAYLRKLSPERQKYWLNKINPSK